MDSFINSVAAKGSRKIQEFVIIYGFTTGNPSKFMTKWRVASTSFMDEALVLFLMEYSGHFCRFYGFRGVKWINFLVIHRKLGSKMTIKTKKSSFSLHFLFEFNFFINILTKKIYFPLKFP